MSLKRDLCLPFEVSLSNHERPERRRVRATRQDMQPRLTQVRVPHDCAWSAAAVQCGATTTMNLEFTEFEMQYGSGVAESLDAAGIDGSVRAGYPLQPPQQIDGAGVA